MFKEFRDGLFFGGYTYQGSSTSEIYTAINTPTTYYYNPSDGGWFSSNPDSWTRANYPTSSTSKSIFDPCPYGYRVPTSNANTNSNSDFFGFPTPPNSNGASWLGFWWPPVGYRIGNSATVVGVGLSGNYWSASPYPPPGPYGANFLGFYSGYVNLVNCYNRSYGLSVRCVQE